MTWKREGTRKPTPEERADIRKAIELETMRDANYFAMCPICGDIRPNTVTHYDVVKCYNCGAMTKQKPLEPGEDWIGLRPCATIYQTVLNPFRPVNMLDALIEISGLSKKSLSNSNQHGTETPLRKATLQEILYISMKASK